MIYTSKTPALCCVVLMVLSSSVWAYFYPGVNVEDAYTMGLWHMDEAGGSTIYDATGYFNGTLTGSPAPTWTTGRFDGGLHLTRTGNNGINLGSLSSYYGTFTFEFYFKWDYAYVAEPGLLFYVPEALFARTYLVDHGASPATLQIDYGVRGGDGSWNEVFTPADSRLTNDWHHLAFTRKWDGTNTSFSVYIDGELAATKSFNLGFLETTPPSNLFIGGSNSIGGIVDEARFSNTIRTKFGIEGCGDWGFSKGDVNKDCKVDLKDMAQMAEDWLKCTTAYAIGCESAL